MLLQELEYENSDLVSSEQTKLLLAKIVAPAMWIWLFERWEDKIFSIHILFISKTVKVKSLKPVWIAIFGPPPAGV